MALSALALVDLVQAKAHLRIDAVTSLHMDAEYVGVGTAEGEVEFALPSGETPLSGSLVLKVNNVLQVEDTDFTIAAEVITFEASSVPADGHVITASYDYEASADTFESYDDELLENLINAATKKAEDYTGRAFVQGEITESHIGDGTKILKLYRQPIVSLASVTRYYNERVGTGDASTVEFILDNTPLGAIQLYMDGVLQVLTTDYTISGAVITFVSAPADETRISANYRIRLNDYTERLNIGRLNREALWAKDYTYEVVYTAGYGATRAATQALVPDAMAAVLLMVAYLYENRTDMVHGESVSGIGSVTYELPLYIGRSGAKQYLDALRVSVL